MRIAYFCCHHAHLRLGELSAASAKVCMPGVEIVHLTDQVTDPMPGADTVLRFATAGNFWRRSWTAAAELAGDVLLVGTDTLFRKDVSHVFEREFDVAMPHIAGPWRYDAGTVFYRSDEFFRRAVARPVADLSEEELYREGPGLFLSEFHAHVAAGPSPRELIGRIYGYAPRSASDPRIADAAMVHYRGPRKRWMLPGWDSGVR